MAAPLQPSAAPKGSVAPRLRTTDIEGFHVFGAISLVNNEGNGDQILIMIGHPEIANLLTTRATCFFSLDLDENDRKQVMKLLGLFLREAENA